MRIFRLSLLIILLAGCQETEDYIFTVYELDEITISPVDQPFGVLTTELDTIFITPQDFEDTRCPIDVTCVRAGYYEVDLEVRLRADTAFVNLCNGDCNSNTSIKDSVRVELGDKAYGIRLENLLPYPNNAKPDRKQSIYFTVFESLR
jgi:hypothetical protein